MDWLTAAQQLRSTGQAAVLATVASARGHAPREAGAKMVVTTEATYDTIGGGNLEATAVNRARQLLATPTAGPETLQLRLNEHVRNEHGRQCCGGEVNILLEPMPARDTVAIFGIGHVGYELSRIVSRLPLALHLIDSRGEQLEEERLADVTTGRADVQVHHAVAPETVVSKLPTGAHIYVMSHDHAEDLMLCDTALRRGDLGTVGLIGSKAKWARFRKRLAEEGHSQESIATIHCPIGLPEVSGKTPELIAISVAAELAQTLQHASAPHLAAVAD